METAGELLLELADRLHNSAYAQPGTPALEVIAPDGTALIVTLKADRREGTVL